MTCGRHGYGQEFEQRPDVVFRAVRVLAAKAPSWEKFIRFEIGCTRVQRAGVLGDPGACDVVAPGAQRRLVKTARLECRDDGVLRRARRPNLVRVIGVTGRGAGRGAGLLGLLRTPLRREDKL